MNFAFFLNAKLITSYVPKVFVFQHSFIYLKLGTILENSAKWKIVLNLIFLNFLFELIFNVEPLK